MTELQDHIKRLVIDNQISCRWKRSGYGGRAWRQARIVYLPPIKSPITYAVALHEIGHIVGPNPGRRLEKEAAAWLWAKNNAIMWNAAMAKKAAKSIQTYLNWCERKKGAWVPPKDHVSWEIARWTK